MSKEIQGPTSHSYFSQRLRLHYVDWGNHSAPPLLLIHGNRDHCRNWDWVARELRDEYHIIAPDLRGHGDSGWVQGSNYAMIDYVYDVAQLVDQKELDPITIIGHSLGGSITMQYAGLFPERIAKLISIEGLGPSPKMIEDRARRPVYTRMREWIDGTRRLAGRLPRRYASLDEAISRMKQANPRLRDDQAEHLTVHGVIQNEDGTYSWKFDNYTRGFSPYAFNSDEAHALWSRIDRPVLLVVGEDSWASHPGRDGRAKIFPKAEVVSIADAGHWVHHDQLDVFLGHARAFLSR